METAPSEAPTEITFTIEYQSSIGPSNPELRGKGKLIISTVEPFYRFTGETRASVGGATTVHFRSDQIRNVGIDGRRVGFTSGAEGSAKKGAAFVFYCADPATAAEVARLLPEAQEPDFVASQGFEEKLRTLPAAASPWTSVTNQIIAANALAFVIMGCLGAGWFETADMKPYLLYVANNGGATTDGEWWRIVTSMFVHYGLLHLVLNMWALFQTGHFVEKLFGRPLFVLGYFGSGIVASFSSIFWHGDKVWSAGASGAVFGVYGLLLGFMLREKQSIPKPVLQPLFRSTLTFAGYNLVYGMVHPQIDNAAHIGGLVGGLVLGWLVALPADRDIRARYSAARLQRGLGVLAAVTVAAVLLSPRYDYDFRDELKWMDANHEPVAREAELVAQQRTWLAKFQPEKSSSPFADWIEGEAIPFYRNWSQQLDALDLTAGKQTEQRRQVTLTFLQAKLANYWRLSVGLRANDPHALDRYSAAEQQALSQAQAHKD